MTARDLHLADDSVIDLAFRLLPGAIAELKADNDAAERMSVADVNRLGKTIRDGIETLETKHAYTPDRREVVIALEAMGFELEDYRGDPAISFRVANPALEIINIGRLLSQYEPRIAQAVAQAARWDLNAKVVYFTGLAEADDAA